MKKKSKKGFKIQKRLVIKHDSIFVEEREYPIYDTNKVYYDSWFISKVRRFLKRYKSDIF